MDMMKAATDWARAELLGSSLFILFGAAFVAASLGLWHFGKTDVSRAYVIPFVVAGVLLSILGAGLVFGAQRNLAGFASAHAEDAAAFLAAETAHAERVVAQYRLAVFRVMPLIVIACGALLMVVGSPAWRAALLTAIAVIAVVLLIDSAALARAEKFREQMSQFRAPG